MPVSKKQFSLDQKKNIVPRSNDDNLCVVSKSSSILYTKKNIEDNKHQPRKIKELKNVCYKLKHSVNENIPTKVTIKSNIYSKKNKEKPKMKVKFSLETYKPTRNCSTRNTASDGNLETKSHLNLKKTVTNSLDLTNTHAVGDTKLTDIIRQPTKAEDTATNNATMIKSRLKCIQNEPSFKAEDETEIMKSKNSITCSNKYHTLQNKCDSMELRKKKLQNDIVHLNENKSAQNKHIGQRHCSTSKNVYLTNNFLNGNNEVHTAFFASNYCVTGKNLTLWKKMKIHLNTCRSVDNYNYKSIQKFDRKQSILYKTTPITNDLYAHFCFTKNNFVPTHVKNEENTCTSQQSRHSSITNPPICGEFKVIKFPCDYNTKEKSNKDKILSLRSKLCQCKKLKLLSERFTRCTCEPCHKKENSVPKTMELNIKDINNSKNEDNTKFSNINIDTPVNQYKTKRKKDGIWLKIFDAKGNPNNCKNGIKIKKPHRRSRNVTSQIDNNKLKTNKWDIQFFNNGSVCDHHSFAKLSINKRSHSYAEKWHLKRNCDNNLTEPPKRQIKSCPCNRASTTKPNRLILLSPERINFEVKKDGKYLRILNYDNVQMFKCSKHNENNHATCKRKASKKSECGSFLGFPVVTKCVRHNFNYRKLISTVLRSLVKRKKVRARNRDLKPIQQDQTIYYTNYDTDSSHRYIVKKKIICINKDSKCLKARLVQWYKKHKKLLFSNLLKELKKEFSFKRLKSKFPDYKSKEVYKMTLPRKRCFILYTMCPRLYPHFLNFLRLSKQMCQICMVMLAPIVWCPCFVMLACCRLLFFY